MRSTPISQIHLSLGTRIEKFVREKVFIPNGYDDSRLTLEKKKGLGIHLREITVYEFTPNPTLNSNTTKYLRNENYLSSPWQIFFRFFGFDTSVRNDDRWKNLFLAVFLNFIRWQGFDRSSYWSIFTSLLSNCIAMLFFCHSILL
jgi:hypothetical protein